MSLLADFFGGDEMEAGRRRSSVASVVIGSSGDVEGRVSELRLKSGNLPKVATGDERVKAGARSGSYVDETGGCELAGTLPAGGGVRGSISRTASSSHSYQTSSLSESKERVSQICWRCERQRRDARRVVDLGAVVPRVSRLALVDKHRPKVI